jgi:Na+/proline symporter
MSDIDMLNALLTVIGIALLLGSPGLGLGAIAGALMWRGHRVAGAVLGAVAGLVLWLAGWIALI